MKTLSDGKDVPVAAGARSRVRRRVMCFSLDSRVVEVFRARTKGDSMSRVAESAICRHLGIEHPEWQPRETPAADEGPQVAGGAEGNPGAGGAGAGA